MQWSEVSIRLWKSGGQSNCSVYTDIRLGIFWVHNQSLGKSSVTVLAYTYFRKRPNPFFPEELLKPGHPQVWYSVSRLIGCRASKLVLDVFLGSHKAQNKNNVIPLPAFSKPWREILSFDGRGYFHVISPSQTIPRGPEWLGYSTLLCYTTNISQVSYLPHTKL